MTPPKTLLRMAGIEPEPAPLSQACVVVVDAQKEYVTGGLALPEVEPKIGLTPLMVGPS